MLLVGTWILQLTFTRLATTVQVQYVELFLVCIGGDLVPPRNRALLPHLILQSLWNLGNRSHLRYWTYAQTPSQLDGIS